MTIETLLLLVAVGCGIFGWTKLRESHGSDPSAEPVAGTETWTVEEVEALRQGSVEVAGEGRFRRRVGVAGAVEAGADGPLTTSRGRVECVWWRVETVERYYTVVNGERVPGSRVVGQNWSRAPFTLVDGTGVLTVRPDGAEVSGAEEVFSDTERVDDEPESLLDRLVDREVTTALVTTEHALRAGERVFVHSEAHDLRAGTVEIGRPLDGGPFLISTKPEWAVRETARSRNKAVQAQQWQGYALMGAGAALLLALLLL
ncbi:GIDE domain-containing protein [Actinokineospora pegani]|uniref:GIDE domain-containing protein n=1 Tax=Actinokineospora pegani TaxID=2654637 RepID=UPI0012EA919E|nr:GIDE domain-containing protein [Actinokineospora pegani]